MGDNFRAVLYFLQVRNSRLVPFFILLNVVVYVLWHFGEAVGVSSSFMEQNFLVSYDYLLQGRYWTLLTSTFSHTLLFHIFMNMFVLNSFGRMMELVLGAKRFFLLYFTAGIFSSLCHAVVSAFVMGDPSQQALGASGAVSGVILLFSLMYPKEKILLLGIIPMPAIVGALLFIGLDVWGLFAQAGGGGLPIGHGAHLGGAFIGVIFYFLFRKRRLGI